MEEPFFRSLKSLCLTVQLSAPIRKRTLRIAGSGYAHPDCRLLSIISQRGRPYKKNSYTYKLYFNKATSRYRYNALFQPVNTRALNKHLNCLQHFHGQVFYAKYENEGL